jgi:hypothetical protein
MIGALLQGGLGNQMFQIATTVALAKRNNDEACFNFDYCSTPLQGNPSNKYKDELFSKICNRNDVRFSSLYNEPKFSYTEIPYQENLLLRGYFQSPKYFLDFEKEIKELFTLPKNIWFPFKKNITNLTSVHVRRGDYIKLQNYHNLCPKEYYLKAMEMMGDVDFIFVSDDMNWVKENFKGDNIFYSDSSEELLDLTLMSICDNNIISNSSFSWWGAFLNDNPNKKVIAPSNWFGPEGPKDTQDIYPTEWITI